MQVFVVIADAMGGEQFVGAHRARPDAGTAVRVLEVKVIGPQPDSEFVYIAQTYDRTMDVHNFKGVYGDYESARGASGPQGSTLEVKI